jgi:hypothetical protein
MDSVRLLVVRRYKGGTAKEQEYIFLFGNENHLDALFIISLFHQSTSG